MHLIAYCYPTALKGCRGIVFTHGVRMGGRAGIRADGGKKFVRAVSHKPYGVGVQRHGLTLI